jgi:hypothetical protein
LSADYPDYYGRDTRRRAALTNREALP